MNKLTLVFLLFIGLGLSAQEKNFEDLFVPARESCWQKDQRIPNLISKNTRQQNKENLDSLLNYWQKDCENSEVLIRTQLLHELSQGQKLDSTVSLAAFYRTYINNLSYLRHSDSYQKYLNYTSQWAEELLKTKKDWAAREKLCLEILSKNRYQAALNRVYRRSSYRVKDGPSIGKAIAKDFANSTKVSIDIGYQTKVFTQSFGENLGQAHGFILSAGANNYLHNLGVDFSLSFPESSDSLRIDLEGQIQKSGINTIIYFGLFYGYEFLKAPRTSLAFRTSFGYNIMATDLDTYDPENDIETRFDLESLSLGIGLEWKIRVYGSRQIGLRGTYNYCNFSRNNELRSNLAGDIISGSLFFRF